MQARDRRCCGQEHAQIDLPVNAGGDVCARVAGELDAAAKIGTVPTSPTEVQAMFVGFDDQPHVHEVGSSTESDVHITSIKYSCELCKMSSSSAAPSSSESCGSKLLLATLEPPPNLTCFGDLLRYLGDCCGFVGGSANALCVEVLP